jgi:hypothetical protein
MSKISILTLVWPWHIGQRSNMDSFPDSLGMTFYTLAILIFALNPIVEKLFSIEIVILHTFTLSKYNQNNINHRKLPRTNLRKDLLGIMKQVFVHLWHLRFWRRFLKILLFSKFFTSCLENIRNFGFSWIHLKEDTRRHITAKNQLPRCYSFWEDV